MVKINHPYIKRASRWLRNHPLIATSLVVLAFVLRDVPQWLASVWSLRSSKPLLVVVTEQIEAFKMPHFSLYWITTPLGWGMLIVILYLLFSGRRSESRKESRLTAEKPTPKLTFEIDEASTQVHFIGGGADYRMIEANVKLRCLKAAEGVVGIRDFRALLCVLPEGKSEEMLVASQPFKRIYDFPEMQPAKMDDGWIIREPISNYRWIGFHFEIPKTLDGELSRNHFFRITMDVVGQEPSSKEFYVDSWTDARASNSSVTLKQPETSSPDSSNLAFLQSQARVAKLEQELRRLQASQAEQSAEAVPNPNFVCMFAGMEFAHEEYGMLLTGEIQGGRNFPVAIVEICNEFSTERKVDQVPHVSAEIDYRRTKDNQGFKVKRGSWLNQSAYRLDFNVNDRRDLIIAGVVNDANPFAFLLLGELTDWHKELATRVVALKDGSHNVTVRLIRESSGTLFKEFKFTLQIHNNPFSVELKEVKD